MQTVLIGEFSSQIVFNYKKEVPDVLESVEKDITRSFLRHVTHRHDIIPLPLSKYLNTGNCYLQLVIVKQN